MPFLYLRDPLFLLAFGLYWVNRLLIEPRVVGGFFHDHFNDLICVAFLVPIVLWVEQLVGLRPKDDPPETFEVLLCLVVWSVMFEVLFARHPFWSRYVVGDPEDVAWYFAGGCAALWWWRNYYARGPTPARKDS